MIDKKENDAFDKVMSINALRFCGALVTVSMFNSIRSIQFYISDSTGPQSLHTYHCRLAEKE